MVLIAFLLRLAVIPFDTVENLMDASHLHACKQGDTAHRGTLSQDVPINDGSTTTQHEESTS
jgi:hypothetical protein